MRWSRSMLLPALLLALLLAACGGSTASTDGDGGNGGDESDAPAATATQTEESAPSDDDGNGNGGHGAFDDLDQLAEDLMPPNSTETSRTTAGGLLFVSFDSSDSPEDLEGFYEDAIADTGLDIFSRTSAGGSFSWIFGIDEQGTTGGVVSVAPGSPSGSVVAIQIGVNQ